MIETNLYLAPLQSWIQAFRGTGSDPVPGFTALYGEGERDQWRHRYLEIFERYAMTYGDQPDVVVARCPGQMNIMGMHMDYGGMPSLRMAVSGADLITVAGQPAAGRAGRVHMESVFCGENETEGSYEPFELDLKEAFPLENVGTDAALKEYAGKICREREVRTGSPFESRWEILPTGALIFLESHFRSRAVLKGFDALIWSNLSPTGGLSSSSALVMSTAYAALGVSGLMPERDIDLQALIEGLGLSEWIRGTRGGTADHMGMVAGGRGELACVGAMPVREMGRATLPSEYEAVAFDSGVPRVYDEAVKEETAMAYPLATFLVREILLKPLAGRAALPSVAADVRGRLHYIRDISTANLPGLTEGHICEILKNIPQVTTLRRLREMAAESGSMGAYEAMRRAEIDGRFTSVDEDYPLPLRRRVVFALAEQDRVFAMVDCLNNGQMERSLTLIRKSHDGERDEEVSDAMLDEIATSPGLRLCDLCGGYGRMTPAYDRVATVVNDFLNHRGEATGAVQRLGAGWGGNIGGLIRSEFLKSRGAGELEQTLRGEFGLEISLADSVVRPGAGACLIQSPRTVRV